MLLEQDLYVLLNLAVNPQRRWTFSSLSQDLLISPSQLHLGLNRANLSGLYHFDERRVVKSALEEFVIHGVRYAYPAEKGPIIRGMPTSFAAPPLKMQLVLTNDTNIPVWDDAEGTAVGYSIKPLHLHAPKVCWRDHAFYEILALVDAIREGRARERKLASEEIHKRLGKSR